jgi:hypothetical protein
VNNEENPKNVIGDLFTNGPCYCDRDQKIRLAYNEFEYKKTKDDCKIGDRFLKKGKFSIAHMRNRR